MHPTARRGEDASPGPDASSARVRFRSGAVAGCGCLSVLLATGRRIRAGRVARIAVAQHDTDEAEHQRRHHHHHEEPGDGEADPEQHTGGVEQHAA